jgi:hypothetical protein
MKVALTPHQERFVGKKWEGGGCLSVIETDLRRSLQSPLRKPRHGHFAGLALRKGIAHGGR